MNMLKKYNVFAFFILCIAFLSGCATVKPYDYTAFKKARPRSIVVLPPLNSSPDVKATYSVLSHATMPLGEAGYYVLPVALVDETFKQNGLTNPADMHAASLAKLKEIFGADAALYINVKEYGAHYSVISSEAAVSVEAKLVDLHTSQLLWSGSARASSAEDESSNSDGGLVGLLVEAVVKQVINNLSNVSHTVAGTASNRLLQAGQPGGILYGPRSQNYGKD